jgi:hypothetical protein
LAPEAPSDQRYPAQVVTGRFITTRLAPTQASLHWRPHRTAYYMLKRNEPYRDLGPEWLAQRNDEAHTRRLVTQSPGT